MPSVRSQPVELMRQLGRRWAELGDNAGESLVFVEPSLATPGNIYAAMLPPLADRLTPACSLVATTAPAVNDLSAMRSIGIEATAHAPTVEQACTLLDSLVEVVRPGDRPWVYAPVAHAGAGQITMMPGVPFNHAAAWEEDGSGVAWHGWRLIGTEIMAGVQPLSPYAGSEDGQASARLQLVAYAQAVRIAEPAVAFEIHHDSSATATVTVDAYPRVDAAGRPVAGGTLTLNNGSGGINTFDLADPLYDTLGELRAAIHALAQWTVENADGSLDGRASFEILSMPATMAVATGDNSAPVRVCA